MKKSLFAGSLVVARRGSPPSRPRRPARAARAISSSARAARSCRRSSRSGRRTIRRRRASISSTSRSALAAASRRSRRDGRLRRLATRRSRPTSSAACKGCFQIPWALGGDRRHGARQDERPRAAEDLRAGAREHLPRRDQDLGCPGDQGAEPWRSRFPSEPIVPVYRSDGSGTSYAFTDYLSSVSPAWKSKIGVSTQPAFPVGVGAKGSSGVSGVVSKTEGAIGYADIAFAITNHIPVMAVKNAAGKFLDAGARVDQGGGRRRSRACPRTARCTSSTRRRQSRRPTRSARSRT